MLPVSLILQKSSRSFGKRCLYCIIKRAIEEPLRQIVANAGKEGAVVVQKVREGKGDFGYNARTDVYENLHAAGVVDPAKELA